MRHEAAVEDSHPSTVVCLAGLYEFVRQVRIYWTCIQCHAHELAALIGCRQLTTRNAMNQLLRQTYRPPRRDLPHWLRKVWAWL